MNKTTVTQPRKIDKKHIAAMTLFAMRYVPNVDKTTLNRFLELVNLTGNKQPFLTKTIFFSY